MTNTEIKKALYKQKPTAQRNHTEYENGVPKIITYVAILDDGTVISFEVPVKDMGETPFDSAIPAQLLIRWIV